MLVEFLEYVINIDDIKYCRCERYGYSSIRLNGAKMPKVTIEFEDGNKHIVLLKDDYDINKYDEFKQKILKYKGDK